jgi:hypothetical protein
MGNSEEKHLPYKGLSDLNFSSFVLTLECSAIFLIQQPHATNVDRAWGLQDKLRFKPMSETWT